MRKRRNYFGQLNVSNSELEDVNNSVRNRTKYVSAPYLAGTSERVQRIFRREGVTLCHKASNSISSQIVSVKDKR